MELILWNLCINSRGRSQPPRQCDPCLLESTWSPPEIVEKWKWPVQSIQYFRNDQIWLLRQGHQWALHSPESFALGEASCHVMRTPTQPRKSSRAKDICLLPTPRASFLDILMLRLGNKSRSPIESLQMIEASADTWTGWWNEIQNAQLNLNFR